MKQQYLIVGIVALVAIILFFAWPVFKNQKSQADTNTTPAIESNFPDNKVANDKLVIVEDISETDIKKIVQDFCNTYNKVEYQATPRLTKLSDKNFAISFPYDISFEIFCYFINYVNYPMGFDRRFKATGWTTTKTTDNWITEKSANKNAMLYIGDFDTEYDNVFLTTADNIGYKLGFAMGEEKQLLEMPEKIYTKQHVTADEIEVKEYTDFK